MSSDARGEASRLANKKGCRRNADSLLYSVIIRMPNESAVNYILVFILPLPSDMVLLSFLRRMARRSEALLPLGAPVVNTSPGETAPLGSLGMGAVPLGTALGLAVPVPGGVWVGVVWAEAAVKLHRPAASSKGNSFMGKGKKRLWENVPQNGAEGCG